MENIVRLKSFAYSLSNNVNIVTTEQRRALHLAAVYANNFANFMVTVARICCWIMALIRGCWFH